MSIQHKFVVPKQKSKTSDNPLAKPRLILVVGGCGAGKSTLVANLLMALEDTVEFDEALFVTGNNRDDMLKTLEMDVTTSPQMLDDFITKIKQPSKEPKYNLLVLDDLQGSPDFNIMLGRSNFAKFVLSHRHYGKINGKGGTWVIATAQTLKNSYTPVFRDNVTLWFTFYPRSEKEYKSFEEISGDKMKMRKALALQKLEGQHSFLYINKTDDTNVRYFLGFDRELDLT